MSLDTDCYMSVGVSALWVLPRWWEFTDELVACLLHIVPNSLGVLLIHLIPRFAGLQSGLDLCYHGRFHEPIKEGGVSWVM